MEKRILLEMYIDTDEINEHCIPELIEETINGIVSCEIIPEPKLPGNLVDMSDAYWDAENQRWKI